jgi:hypothetical protein
LSKQDILYITLTGISRGFWISSQKFEIQPVAAHMAILVECVSATLREKWSSPIRMIYISSLLNFQGDSESELGNLKFSTYGYIVLWPLLGKMQPSPIRMFYTSSSSEFQEGFEYPARNFKFSLWQQIWLHLYNVFQSHSHITGKFDLHQSGWSIYHPDLNLMENLNLNSEISNLACDSTYGYICISATLRGNLTFTNQDELYIILTRFLRRVQIWSQKF